MLVMNATRVMNMKVMSTFDDMGDDKRVDNSDDNHDRDITRLVVNTFCRTDNPHPRTPGTTCTRRVEGRSRHPRTTIQRQHMGRENIASRDRIAATQQYTMARRERAGEDKAFFPQIARAREHRGARARERAIAPWGSSPPHVLGLFFLERAG